MLMKLLRLPFLIAILSLTNSLLGEDTTFTVYSNRDIRLQPKTGRGQFQYDAKHNVVAVRLSSYGTSQPVRTFYAPEYRWKDFDPKSPKKQP